ncbi:uncharacterized protein TNCV_1735361 [Trichonephila clavipes]|nr:uncharacterized protein TNCV_1735361 [Trichonephila clavipes]
MVKNEAGIVVCRQSFNYAEQMDKQRVNGQNRRSSLESKETRKALLQAQNEVYEKEGLLYAIRGLLAKDHVILNHGQVTWTTPELSPPLPTTTPHQREDVSALDRFNVHRCPPRRIFSGTGLELVARQVTIRYLYHSATAATLGFETPYLWP